MSATSSQNAAERAGAGETRLVNVAQAHRDQQGIRRCRSALKRVSFDLRKGEVHALVGENGAGKSTLIKVITGAHVPDSGTIEIQGQPVADLDPETSRDLGIAAIYQQPALFGELTVAENIAIGLEGRSAWRRVSWAERRARAGALLDRIGAAIDPLAEVNKLSMPEQQLVEIARALGAGRSHRDHG